jgi:hypothetical protein
MRWNSLLALGLVAAGTALATSGPHVFVLAASMLWSAAPVLLIALGGLALLMIAVPSPKLILPGILLLSGAVWFAIRGEWVQIDVGVRYATAVLAIVAGVALVSEKGVQTVDLMRRQWAVLLPRRANAEVVPTTVRLVAMYTRFRLEFELVKVPRGNVVECMITTWWGQVELVVPLHYQVVCGRVHTARWVEFTGKLDSDEVFMDPRGMDLDRLRALCTADHPYVLVLHILGLGGRVSVSRPAAP